jgi:hypothetical protein
MRFGKVRFEPNGLCNVLEGFVRVVFFQKEHASSIIIACVFWGQPNGFGVVNKCFFEIANLRVCCTAIYIWIGESGSYSYCIRQVRNGFVPFAILPINARFTYGLAFGQIRIDSA